ncbi:hypothetical protein DUI87_22259 [Hirundo rustica rustica]|uniref:Uncharacterized protein n=1 Tax=Hirundo rustica rustica TaxID=333673 RepID=A0A3M0JJ60_HIRRU|nr:hypothetical protein DUI87_22259 [Hirundo rustica rustica]
MMNVNKIPNYASKLSHGKFADIKYSLLEGIVRPWKLHFARKGKQRKPQQKHHSLEIAVAVVSRVLEISGSRRADYPAQQDQHY